MNKADLIQYIANEVGLTHRDAGAAIDALTGAGTPLDRITVLHANTMYPTPMEDVNLRAMRTIACAFGCDVGYSDHTMGIEVPVAAKLAASRA